MKNTKNNENMNEDLLNDDELDEVTGGGRRFYLRRSVRRAAPKAIIDPSYRTGATGIIDPTYRKGPGDNLRTSSASRVGRVGVNPLPTP